MNEILSFQNMLDTLAQKAGVQRTVAEGFAKAFFDTIVEALACGEENVKVDGLGTFKLVQVDGHEGANVQNVMQDAASGFRKIAFVAEENVADVLKRKEEAAAKAAETKVVLMAEPELVAPVEAPVVEEKTEVAPSIETSSIATSEQKTAEDVVGEAIAAVPEPERVEQPRDAFGGIDMLISTPESVGDVRQQYEEAKTRAEVAMEEARKANAEKMRLEKLLEHLEENAVPESVSQTEMAKGVQTETEERVERRVELNNPSDSAASVAVPEKTEAEKRQAAFNRVMAEYPKLEVPQKKKNRKGWIIALVCILLAGILFFVGTRYCNWEWVKAHLMTPSVPVPEEPKKTVDMDSVVRKMEQDSLAKAKQKADSIRAALAEKEDSMKVTEVSPEEEKAVVEKPADKNATPEKPADKKPAAEKPTDKKPGRPATHVVQRGESLTRISQKYYGTPDSVKAIVRVNAFKNPDNVPEGAVVKLP